MFSGFGNVEKGNVSGDERDGNHTSGEEHGVVYCPRTRGEEFSLAGNANPISAIRALWIGPVAMASISPEIASFTASPIAATLSEPNRLSAFRRLHFLHRRLPYNRHHAGIFERRGRPQ